MVGNSEDSVTTLLPFVVSFFSDCTISSPVTSPAWWACSTQGLEATTGFAPFPKLNPGDCSTKWTVALQVLADAGGDFSASAGRSGVSGTGTVSSFAPSWPEFEFLVLLLSGCVSSTGDTGSCFTITSGTTSPDSFKFLVALEVLSSITGCGSCSSVDEISAESLSFFLVFLVDRLGILFSSLEDKVSFSSIFFLAFRVILLGFSSIEDESVCSSFATGIFFCDPRFGCCCLVWVPALVARVCLLSLTCLVSSSVTLL